MNINKRLKHIAAYVDSNDSVIDVGCDHAFLCIFLAKKYTNIKLIASDINEGPLKQAKKNIDSYNINNIEIKLGSGISTIDNNINTVIISGMGAKNIINILYDDKDKLSNVKKLILSPNNDFELVRKKITKLGYKILCEEIICERGKFYPIIVLEKGKNRYNFRELFLGYNVLVNDDLKQYYRYLIDSKVQIMNKIAKNKILLRVKLTRKIKLLKSAI